MTDEHPPGTREIGDVGGPRAGCHQDRRNFTAAELKKLVENYGQRLSPLPAEALDDLEARPVPGRDLLTFLVEMPLWTVEAEGPSELVLELELADRYGGAYEVSVLSLRAH